MLPRIWTHKPTFSLHIRVGCLWVILFPCRLLQNLEFTNSLNYGWDCDAPLYGYASNIVPAIPAECEIQSNPEEDDS